MFRHLKALMWLHFTLKRRKFISTGFQILIPILFFAAICHYRGLLRGFKSGGEDEAAVQPTLPYSLDEAMRPSRILYTPDNPLTNALMDQVGAKLGLRRLTKFEGRRSGYLAEASLEDEQVEQFLERMDSDDAVIIFENMDGDVLPKKLNYTIRSNNNYLTSVVDTGGDGLDTRERHEYLATIYGPFMRIQWAIDSSYLHDLDKNFPTNMRIQLREFPVMTHSIQVYNMGLFGILVAILPFVPLIQFTNIVDMLKDERFSGIRELLKMTGPSDSMISLSHYLSAMCIGTVFTISGTVCLTYGPNAIINTTNAFIVMICLFLYYSSIVLWGIALNYLVPRSSFASGLVGTVVYVLVMVAAQFINQKYSGVPYDYFTGLVPHIPLFWFLFNTLMSTPGSPVMWSTMLKDTQPIYITILYLVLQCLIFIIIAWYLQNVRPGPYGVAKPWSFPLTWDFWRRNKRVHMDTDSEVQSEEQVQLQDKQYFEPPPKNMEVGIRVANVTKIFSKYGGSTLRAVNNVSFDVYKGEITVLLGHNGAGKTTLMNIITGMYSPTSGRVEIMGDNKLVGYCPQHNLFFNDITVIEHLIFFNMLATGSTITSATRTAKSLLEQVIMKEKANNMAQQLSGGMKRRLQLTIALAGGATLLVLDEPTSGLDIESRRSLWDLLLELRGSRTVLLTTHFMEEADALGDRCVALHTSNLRCCATPMFLKRSIGSGYRLSLTTNGIPRETEISSLVTSVIPNATLKDRTINSLMYNLPSDSSRLPTLFTQIEAKKEALNIECVGVGTSKLEDVFLKLCSDSVDSVDETDKHTILGRQEVKKGFNLWKRQFVVLMQRQFKYTRRGILSFVLLNLLCTILLFGSVYLTNNSLGHHNEGNMNQRRALSLNMYRHLEDPQGLYSVGDNVTRWANYRRVFDANPGVTFRSSENMSSDTLVIANKGPTEFRKYIVGVEISDDVATAWYSSGLRHTAPVALNLLSNTLASIHLKSEGNIISVYNHPLKSEMRLDDPSPIVRSKSDTSILVFAFPICLFLILPALYALGICVNEKRTGSRHNMVLNGTPAYLPWLVALLYHTALYMVMTGILALIVFAVADTDGVFHTPSFLMTMFLVMLLGAMSTFLMMYLLSVLFNDKLAYTLSIVSILSAGSFVSAALSLRDPESIKFIVLTILIRALSIAAPTHYATGIIATCNTAAYNGICDLNRHKCPEFNYRDPNFDVNRCCGTNENMASYFSFKASAPLTDIIIMACFIVIQLWLLLMIEYGFLERDLTRLRMLLLKPSAPVLRYDDPVAKEEKTYVSSQAAKGKCCEKDELMVSDVKRYYGYPWKKPMPAVKGISFAVKKDECFGMLGVNGAGKSTTFKMMTCEITPHEGNIYSDRYNCRQQRQQYMRQFGYCPQFGGVDEFLTGRECLKLVLTLRGYDDKYVEEQTSAWIRIVGLEKYADRPIQGYSGGCKRRASTAASLVAHPPLPLLDEPTAGVDSGARRRLWAAVKSQRPLLLTSHSMDETEALCTRLCILSGGEIAALGSPEEIRRKHATGHSLVIKMKPTEEGDYDAQVLALKNAIVNQYECTLKDAHKTMLNYNLTQTIPYSTMFTQMEDLKKSHPIIEDYSVSDTTLEDVFLQIAKDAREPEAKV